MSGTPPDEYVDPGQIILDAPIAPRWKGEQLPLFLTARDLWRILGFHHMYQQVLGVHGDFFEFGVGHGRDLNILSCLRQVLEPRVPRRFVGFDTFGGLPEEDISDVDGPKAKPGYCATPEGYVQWLGKLLSAHNPSHPSSDNLVVELVRGRVQDTLDGYLAEDQAAIAFAMIDYTIYEPTKYTLKRILGRMPAGAIVAFNQFKTPYWQAGARALREVAGIHGQQLRRNPYHRYWAYLVIQ